MKRCPECRRDYYDDSLRFCLDDGTALLEGPRRTSAPTVASPEGISPGQENLADMATIRDGNTLLERPLVDGVGPSEDPTRELSNVSGAGQRTEVLNTVSGPKRLKVDRWLLIGAAAFIVFGTAAGYFFYRQTSRHDLQGSFRELGSPANDYYLRGKLDSDSENDEHNSNARKILEDVVKADPTFAPAFAELARAYTIRANDWAPADEKPKLMGEARVAVEKSLALDPNLAEGHLVRAFVMWTETGRFPHEQTVQSLKRAIELDPNLGNAHQQLGLVYLHIGLLDKARVEDQKAITIDPTDSGSRLRLGLIEQYGGDPKKALTIIKTVPTDTNPAIVNRALATLMFQLGRTKEASAIVDDFLAANPDEGGNVTSVKAMLLAKAGRADDAEAAIQRAVEIGRGYQHFHHTMFNIACAYALLNKNEEAIKWLQDTIDDGFPCYPLFASYPDLNNLKGDERLITLMASLKQQWEGYKATL